MATAEFSRLLELQDEPDYLHRFYACPKHFTRLQKGEVSYFVTGKHSIENEDPREQFDCDFCRSVDPVPSWVRGREK